MTHRVKNVLPLQAELAECPLWSVQEQVLWCVDILAPAIHRFDPASGELSTFPQAEEVGCIGLREQGGIIAALRSGVWLLDEQGKPQKKVADNPGIAGKSRFNDGRVDPWGNFWCGSLWEPQDKNGGLLCRVTPDLTLEVKARDIKISNGVAFSPDRQWMYHSDTPNEVLYRYPLDAQGEPGQREIFRRFDARGGLPDGAAVDSEGYYWSALFDGGRVVRIDPHDGEIVDEITLPVKWPTMVTFGGSDLKTLFITSSRENLSEEDLARYPQSGDIFAVDVDVAGMEEPRFRG
ncbi:sugar lactone lactonase YvrE [Pantoea sp. PNA 14-12]|uniref:Gluconolactonase n=1 Tax=Pantoea stewartii TaxID=66269 RepID=A0AB34VGR6_9GAMM|nr:MULTISPECIES: SMP-30/gluconolactonase/LRE family protein [Pantoea]KKW49828.1 gluconolactonase [Pantoea ananatis]KHE01678.1 gluconolactonase [Pantoea stewartii]KHN62812.1 gluconolactonase [Pantoea stewartii]KTS29689.1 gluconolactonase [Pantoea stewartii]KTS74007.1 gluconolactonase [Pantoea stewartii]